MVDFTMQTNAFASLQKCLQMFAIKFASLQIRLHVGTPVFLANFT
jgi:hypothetical protein